MFDVVMFFFHWKSFHENIIRHETLEILILARERHGPRNHINLCTEEPWRTEPYESLAIRGLQAHQPPGRQRLRPHERRLQHAEAAGGRVEDGGDVRM